MRRRDVERRPADVRPLDVDGIRTVAVITVAWAVAFVALALRRAELEEAGLGWFLWTCLAGVGLGLLGLEYCRKRRDAIARAELEAEAAADLDDWDDPGEAGGFDQRYDDPAGHGTDEQPAVTFAEAGWEEPGAPPTEPPEYHDQAQSEPAWGEPGQRSAGPPVYPGRPGQSQGHPGQSPTRPALPDPRPATGYPTGEMPAVSQSPGPPGAAVPDAPPGTGEQPVVDPLHPDWQAPTGPIPPAHPPQAHPPPVQRPQAPPPPVQRPQAPPPPVQPSQRAPRPRQPAPEPPPPPPPHRQPPAAPPPSRHRREPSPPFPVETASPAAYSPEPDLARRHPRDRELSERSHREEPAWDPLEGTPDPRAPDASSDRDLPTSRPAGPTLDSEFFADVGPRPDPGPADSDDLLGDLVGGEADPGEGSGGGRRARRDADEDTAGPGETYRGRRARRAP